MAPVMPNHSSSPTRCVEELSPFVSSSRYRSKQSVAAGAENGGYTSFAVGDGGCRSGCVENAKKKQAIK